MNLFRRHPGELLAAAGVLLGWVLIESANARYENQQWYSWTYWLELQIPFVDLYIKVATLFLCFRAAVALMLVLLLTNSVRTLFNPQTEHLGRCSARKMALITGTSNEH